MSVRDTVAGAAQRAFNAISRGTLVAADDAHKFQEGRIRVKHGNDWSHVEVVHPYGFTAVAKPAADDKTSDAAEVIVVFPDGSRSHPVVIVCGDRRYRLQGLEAGEVALHDDQGQKVHLMRAGVLVVSPKPVTVQSDDTITLKAPVVVLDSLDIRLGGPGATRPVSAEGTVTSDAAVDQSNFLTAVKGL